MLFHQEYTPKNQISIIESNSGNSNENIQDQTA